MEDDEIVVAPSWSAAHVCVWCSSSYIDMRVGHPYACHTDVKTFVLSLVRDFNGM